MITITPVTNIKLAEKLVQFPTNCGYVPAVPSVELTVTTVSRSMTPGELLTEAHSITFVLAPSSPGSVTGFAPCNETATLTPVSKY